MHAHREERQRNDGEAEGGQVDVVGVEHRDHGDRQQVVDDGEGEQEGSQSRGQVGRDDGEDGDGEGDSVAVGIAQPRSAPSPTWAVKATKTAAGTIIPPTAAAMGSAARAGSRRSPATNSRLSSRPTMKKKRQ